MSYMYNKRRGGKANKSRPPRLCTAYDNRKGDLKCGAVADGKHGNLCEDHRGN